MNIFFEEIRPFKFPQRKVVGYLKNLVQNEGMKLGEISIVFCSDQYLLEMNKKHLDHDYFTDVITFNYVEKDIISGDIFISIDRVKENAEIFKTEWKTELLRVMFHGVLHLVGYNDKSVVEKEQMREKEDFYLKEVDFSELKI